MKVDNNIEVFKEFYLRYKSFGKQLITQQTSVYSNIFQTCKEIKEVGLKEEEVITTSFNIFNILKVEKYEDETHTPFLTDLLDIHGSHRQKDLFYNLFLREIIPDGIERLKFTSNNPTYYHITSQKGVYTQYGQGFLDIFIDYLEPGRKSFGIVIENKIYHGDGDNQLNKYVTYLEGLFRDNFLLIYLTPTGKRPEFNSITPDRYKELITNGKLKLVSYHNDIQGILNESLNYIKSNKVKYTVLQYISLINSL